MVAAIALDSKLDIPAQIRWAVRLAAARSTSLLLLLPVEQKGEARVVEVDLASKPEGDGEARVIRAVQTTLEELPGVRPEPTTEKEDAGGDEEADTGEVGVRLRILHHANLLQALLGEVRASKINQLILVRKELDAAEAEISAVLRQVFRRAPCEVVMLRMGSEDGDGCANILTPAARGPHSKAAMRLARDLASAVSGQVTALYVEPDIGADADLVGRRVLNRLVTRALGKDAGDVRQKVEVADEPHRGIADVCEKEAYDLVLLGASKMGALGRRIRGSISGKVMRSTLKPAVAIVRAEVPISNRLKHFVESYLNRVVPQLEREHRVTLVERVQSNSHWDFDFITLLCLSTIIAAMGLIQNSAAVVIGAMLVAPLMTPLLGIGIAVVQGNPLFARIAMRAVVFGFLMAFLIGIAVGFLHPGFEKPTEEMASRDWPGLLDLLVAFAAGLAAAYASSRPSLLAALPGVAIAAALLPPIATAGLAVSLGDFDLAMGATLLFVTNMVAIVFASTLSLWAVGLRNVRKPSRLTAVMGAVLTVTVLCLAVYLSLSPPRYTKEDGATAALIGAVERRLGGDFRLHSIQVSSDPKHLDLVVHLGGSTPPSERLADEIGAIARDHYDRPVRIRVTYRWEVDAGTTRGP